MFSLLSLCCQAFADGISAQLGKGRQHAEIIYESFFRTGRAPVDHPAFRNAPALQDSILALMELSLPTIVVERHDGETHKLVLRLADGLEVESVLIPMQAGGTLCISSQVGCRMACAFCETGRMGLLRNLTVEEIVAQVFLARHAAHFNFNNVVFMGMGEPFDNYEAVLQAAKVLMEPRGLGFGKRKITISTSGCVESIYRYAEQGIDLPNLAVSINGSFDAQRSRLMPINRKHDMGALYEAMRHYCEKSGRQILAAYVLLEGINDTLEDADRLAHFLRGLNVKINLIPYNPQSRDRFKPPSMEMIDLFVKRLREAGIGTLLRRTRGRPIMAGCGQLGNVALRKSCRA